MAGGRRSDKLDVFGWIAAAGLVAIGLGVLAAAGIYVGNQAIGAWEEFEYKLDHTPGLRETMGYLMLGAFGAAVGWLVLYIAFPPGGRRGRRSGRGGSDNGLTPTDWSDAQHLI